MSSYTVLSADQNPKLYIFIFCQLQPSESGLGMGEVRSGINQSYTGTRMRPVVPSNDYGTGQGKISSYTLRVGELDC